MKFTNSIECTKSELDLFSVPPTQTSIENAEWDTIYPTLNNKVIQFEIPPSQSYLDLSQTDMFMNVHIEQKIGISSFLRVAFETSIQNSTVGSKIAPVNNFFHSLFNQVEIFFNNTPVENSNELYSYRAYIENLLNYNKEDKETFLKAEGFAKDDAGEFENFMIEDEEDQIRTWQTKEDADWSTAEWATVLKKGKKANKGLLERRNLIMKNQTCQLRAKLHCDVFNLNRYLINGVGVTIKLTRNKEQFSILGDNDNKEYFVRITNPILKIRKASISPKVMVAHALALEKTNAKYPITRVVMNQIAFPLVSKTKVLPSIHNGLIPSKILIGFVDTDSFTGEYNKNPYNFQHFNINSLILKIGGKSLPYTSGLTLDYNNNSFSEAYYSLFQNIKMNSNDLTIDDYKNGSTFYAFNLSPDLCQDEHFNILTEGSIDLHLSFESLPVNTERPQSVTAIIYKEFTNIMEITKLRQILFDYKI